MAATASARQPTSRRAEQRDATRERVYRAALAGIARAGLGAADVGAIAAEAGVARGTFYFHFPTMEHVLVDLERREELRIVAALERRAVPKGNLRAVFAAVLREVRAAERRLGPSLFRAMLSIHFGATGPDGGRFDDHPLGVFIVEAVWEARRRGRVDTGIDPVDVAVIFLSGLFALLTTRGAPGRVRDAMLDTYVKVVLDGVVRS
jgi:AcrR family transcriptional regulator